MGVDERKIISYEELPSLDCNMDEKADEANGTPATKQSEESEPESEPTKKPLLKESDNVTRFFKKVAVMCCSPPDASSVRSALPPAPSVCGEETNAPPVVKVMYVNISSQGTLATLMWKRL